ncbi:hypothetical protein [Methylocaldum marinum]|nr:hypothetical protein [Methylocaldum marinum]
MNHVIELAPSELNDWLDAILNNRSYAPKNFNWLGLAEILARRALETRSLQWAHLAIRVYEYRARSADKDERDSLLCSEMRVRVHFIKQFGLSKEDGLLDINTVVSWFMENTDCSLEWAKNVSDNWLDKLQKGEITIETINALRKIKNRINIVKSLDSLGFLDGYPEVRQWIALSSQLP